MRKKIVVLINRHSLGRITLSFTCSGYDNDNIIYLFITLVSDIIDRLLWFQTEKFNQ